MLLPLSTACVYMVLGGCWKKKLLNSRTGNIKPCNCRNKDEYPLNGQCLVQDIVYKYIASTSINPEKT